MRTKSKAALAATGALALIGCFTVHFDIDSGNIDGSIYFELGSLDGDCVDENPNDAVQQEQIGDQCHIHVTYDGDMIDMQKVRDAIEASIAPDHHLSELSELDFQTATVTFHSIDLTEGKNPAVPVFPKPLVTDWSADVSLAGSPLVSFSGSNTTELLAAQVQVEVGADEVDMIEEAFDTITPVPGTGEADFTVSMASLQDLVGRSDLRVTVLFDIVFTGEGGAEAL